jgi:hypothetical protein
MKFLPPVNFTGDDFPAVANVLTAVGPSCVPNLLLLLVFPLLASLVDAAWLSAVALSLFLLAFLLLRTPGCYRHLCCCLCPPGVPLAFSGDSIVAGFLALVGVNALAEVHSVQASLMLASLQLLVWCH